MQGFDAINFHAIALDMVKTLKDDRRVADSLSRTWVDKAYEPLRPYLRLARYDRPIGFWLLVLPCWMGLAQARLSTGLNGLDLYWAALFALGSIAMRGAGCTYNDIIDRDLDKQVERTADRPLAAGTISLKKAWIFLGAQGLVGLIVLLLLPLPAILTGLGALILVAGYPFMKRITWWPQAWLGFTFNWGVLVGASVVLGTPFEPGTVLLYLACIVWTLAYDTIYACQDMDDDAMIGVKSSARALGAYIKPGVIGFYTLSILLFGLSALMGTAGLFFAIGFAFYCSHIIWILHRFDPCDGQTCLDLFKANRTTGIVMVSALLLGSI